MKLALRIKFINFTLFLFIRHNLALNQITPQNISRTDVFSGRQNKHSNLNFARLLVLAHTENALNQIRAQLQVSHFHGHFWWHRHMHLVFEAFQLQVVVKCCPVSAHSSNKLFQNLRTRVAPVIFRDFSSVYEFSYVGRCGKVRVGEGHRDDLQKGIEFWGIASFELK